MTIVGLNVKPPLHCYAVVIVLVLLFSIMKRIIKLIVFVILLLLAFLAYVHYTGGNVKDTLNKVKERVN